EEVLLIRLHGRADDSLHSGRGRRLEMVSPAPIQGGLLEMLVLVVGGKDVPTQPLRQLLGVDERRPPEPEDGADLFPVPLATAARQVVLREGVWLDAELVGEMIPDGDGDLPAIAGEPAFHLKELQDRKSTR